MQISPKVQRLRSPGQQSFQQLEIFSPWNFQACVQVGLEATGPVSSRRGSFENKKLAEHVARLRRRRRSLNKAETATVFVVFLSRAVASAVRPLCLGMWTDLPNVDTALSSLWHSVSHQKWVALSKLCWQLLRSLVMANFRWLEEQDWTVTQ